MDLPELFGCDPLGFERFVDPRHLSAAADQPEVAQILRRQRAERVEVVPVTACQDDGERVGRQLGLCQPLGDRIHHDLLGVRKPLGVGELFAVVDDVELEPDRVGGLGEVIRHMTRPDQVERRRQFEWLDVDLHLTSTEISPASSAR